MEYVDVADMSCQATSKEIESETGLQVGKEKENAQNTSEYGNTSKQLHSFQSNTSKGAVAVPSTSSASVSVPHENTTQALTISKNLSTVTRTSDSGAKSLPPRLETVPKPKRTTSKLSDVAHSTTSTTTPPVIYRTLKSPVISGAPLLPQRVALKSSPPSLPVQQSFTAVKPSLGNVIPLVSPTDMRYDDLCSGKKIRKLFAKENDHGLTEIQDSTDILYIILCFVIDLYLCPAP